MRVIVFPLVWMVVLITGHAQSYISMDYYKGSEMVDRWNSATKKAIAATQPDLPGQRKKKSDPLLQNRYQGKTFEGGGGDFNKKLSGQKDYLYDQKTSTSKFGTRSFFGLKNPWFGKKVVDTGKASLWSKTEVANADKKFPLESADTRAYYQADKNAFGSSETVATRPTEVRGKFQGMVEAISKDKNLTVEQVRELLNKQ